ncbi:hypothetical protein OIU84_003434 [Salix udensis]|uniref:Intron-binding protein aquarius n=1 Tax=Salix udensis TaxID=889485 RepID=A0AAD6P2U5_9ROSI|nr:hypothetical protein OIU84_003434 [Salix udensis]
MAEIWRRRGRRRRAFDAELVKKIYETELKVKEGRKTVPLQRVMILEVSQYLENYLWPNFDPETATFEHVMSMILMINEKFRENVAAWSCFYDQKGVFKRFLDRVLHLKEGRELSIAEKTNYLVFMINAFQSLEDEMVSQTVLKLASFESWHSLSYGRFQMELCLNNKLIKKWRKTIKKEAEEATKRGEVFNPSTSLEVRFLRNFTEEFLDVLDFKVFPQKSSANEDEIDDAAVLYYDEVVRSHYERFQAFQLLAFKKIPKLRELALSNVGAIHKRADLSKQLSVLSPKELKDLVCCKLKLVSAEDPWSERVDFLIEVMVSFFERQQSQKEAINALPLYPNEQIMWDESVVPSINYSGEGCLALPKLNLQFLTLHDYLLRNFNLFRLESTYEIREDIQEATPHLLPYINNEGETAFRGWSRMAVPIKKFKITEVKQPNIGEVKPSSVTAQITFSVSSYKAQMRSEWNALKEHDVLFLLSVCPSFEPLSAEEAEKASVPERLGLQYVRGCEIIEICDEEGTLMNDFSGKIKREEWKPPKGELRTVTVALDTAQYHMDVTDIAERGAQDIYGTFNVLMRRKPKENNFKAILESIRDLMNEYCIVPDWLHNIFLGYGDPSAAQWTKMPDHLQKVDFKDTFLNADHLKESFPDHQVCFVNPNGNEKSTIDSKNGVNMVDSGREKEELIVEAYIPPDPGPYPQDQPNQNSVRFTSTQIGAIMSGIQPGLTMVVGPPGTGKTDTAVQIMNVLYHNCPSQRTLIITHSNQALNDLFEKIMQRDVPARYLLRLGQGEQELATDLDFQ